MQGRDIPTPKPTRPAELRMFWPINHFSRSISGPSHSIEAIYNRIVAQARQPGFYRNFSVPDTVDGRFDLMVLHLWMILRQLRPTAEAGSSLSQALFDHFCSDLDANLREMGVGDLAVPKRMQGYGEAFYGRATAYDAALAIGREALAQALCKNVLNGGPVETAGQLAGYVEATLARLSLCDEAAIMQGKWQFARLPEPVQ